MPKLYSQLSGLSRPILTPMHRKMGSCMGPLREKKKERTTKTMDQVNVSPKSFKHGKLQPILIQLDGL